MTTAIKGCENQSVESVSIVNTENPGDNRVVKPKSYLEVYAWMSQHSDKPLKVQTSKGLCSIWDSNWQVLGQWEGSVNNEVLAQVKNSPQDYKMKITDVGDITLTPLTMHNLEIDGGR